MKAGARIALAGALALALAACDRDGEGAARAAAEDGDSMAAVAATLADSLPEPEALPAGATRETVREGRVIYASSCVVCHGKDGAGTQLGPSVVDAPPSDAATVAGMAALIRGGVPAGDRWPVPMPTYGEMLTAPEVDAVAAYALALAGDAPPPAAADTAAAPADTPAGG